MRKAITHLLIVFLLSFFSTVTLADYMRVSMLGTGSPRPDTKRMGPAVLVEAGGEYLLFDTGRGVVQRLKQLDVPIAELHNVFLTHLHSDHISALDDLWLTSWIYQRQQPLSVYGPVGTESFVQGLQQAYAYDATLRNQYAGLSEDSAKMITTEIEPGVIYSHNGIKVTAFLVDHRPVDPAYGYRIDFGDRSIVISGDTTYSTNLVDHAQNIDLLVHEIFACKAEILKKNPRLQKIERYHTNPDQILEVLDQVSPRMAILTHVIIVGIEENALIQELQDSYAGEVILGEDLMRIEIADDIKVIRFNEIRHQ